MEKQPVYGLTSEELVNWFIENDERKLRAARVREWLYQKRVSNFTEITSLSKQLIEKLSTHFIINPLKQVVVQEASDDIVKYLFELLDKNMIETVLIRQKYGLSVCVTAQAGCNIGCTFYASGLLKKNHDLTAGKIIAQVMMIQHYFDERNLGERVSHVVMMRIGEPFDNYDNVMDFLYIIDDAKGLATGTRHITVSTSGLTHKVKESANNGLQISLAIFLHMPNNEVRMSIMRINRSFPIERLMEAMDEYLEETSHRIMSEYIISNQVNDRPEYAQQLTDLLKDKKRLTYVSLIPYNPVSKHDQYSRSPEADVLGFYGVLKKNGVNYVIRKEHGTDIDAACGQLRNK